MRSLRSCLVAAVFLLASVTGWAQQFGRVVGFEWPATNADAQRTSWVRLDPHISVQSMSKPAFTLQWREKLDNTARESASLSQGVTLNGTYGFASAVSIIGGASNNVFAIDNDTGFPHWRRHIEESLPPPTRRCPGGIVGAPGRAVDLMPPRLQLPAPPAPGRGYTSAVGLPGEGVPMDLARRVSAARGPAPTALPAGAAVAPPPPRGGGGGPAGGARYAGPIYVVSSAGTLHSLGQVSGIDVERPTAFLPPNARYSDLTAVGDLLYTSTSEGCGGAANGVWAITLDADNKRVISWPTNGGSPVGNLAFTTGGKIIVAVGASTAGSGYSNAIVALDAKTLQPTDWFLAGKNAFATTPVVFSQNGLEIVAAATTAGRVYLLDASALGGADHSTPLFTSPAGSTVAPEGLATFALDDTRWLLVPTNDAIAAHRVVVDGKRVTLQQGWASRALAAPTAPIVVNDVVFAAASGREQGPAVLYAFDARSGRELWDSGTTLSSHIPHGNVWSSNSQVYVGTYDGTVEAFGLTLERR